MNALSSERYYNENGDMGVLVSLNKYSFASDDLEMATDKRVIDIFRRFCSKDKDNHLIIENYRTLDAIERSLEDSGYTEVDLYEDMELTLMFIPIGKKFTVDCEEIRGDYGEFEGYCDRLILLEDFDWIEAE